MSKVPHPLNEIFLMSLPLVIITYNSCVILYHFSSHSVYLTLFIISLEITFAGEV